MSHPVRSAVESTLARAMAASAPPDTFWSLLVGSSTWFTGDDKQVDVSIAVPKDADFEATRMDIYLGARLYSQTNPNTAATELAFRPNNWVSVNNPASTAPVVQDANASFMMRDDFNGSYQGDNPLPVGALFSHRYGQYLVKYESITSYWPGGHVFEPVRFFRRGTVVSVTLHPTFSRAANAVIKTQFRAELVLTGRKLIRRAL